MKAETESMYFNQVWDLVASLEGIKSIGASGNTREIEVWMGR
jgi:hypothetical protein